MENILVYEMVDKIFVSINHNTLLNLSHFLIGFERIYTPAQVFSKTEHEQ